MKKYPQGDPQVKEFQSNASEYLLDFKKYAKSFKNFVSKYPYVTIAANGLAISNSTFGDVGKGKFDLLHFATNNFMRRRSEYLVDIVNASDEKLNAYKLIGDISLKEYNKTSIEYVLTYAKYAPSFEKFNEKYPFITIYTNGVAISNDTFGNVGKNKFVDEYEVKVKISLGFKQQDNFLFLIPCISGKLENFDQKLRSLQFGFTLGHIEFNHKECY
ncbi:hypothetical protein PV325_013919 [Microctonus aethiopoides]|nr:hypothetical protein PV325_013919 [Microctonus aethiopoides]